MLTDDGNRLDGCLFGEPSTADYRMEFGDQTLPKRVDLRSLCTAVEDQGRIGSCTANACVGALEYFYRKRDGYAPELSRMFVYFNTRRLKGTIQQDTGAMINEAMAAVMAFGACEAQYWPYDTGLFMREPPQQAYQNGRTHEAIQYARIPGAQGAVSALANGYPVVYGTFLPKRCYDEAARSGRVPKTSPQERTGQPGGGHCMLIVGYDFDEKIFIVRNSWGTQWGNGGYCEIPFEEMAYWSPPDTFWIMLELEPKGKYSVVRPALSQASVSEQKTSSLGVTAKDLRSEIAGDLRRELGTATNSIKARAASLRASLEADRSKEFGYDPNDGKLDLDPPPAQPDFCAVCQGAGSCWYCKGTGINMGYRCGKCTSGQCYVCGGSGYG